MKKSRVMMIIAMIVNIIGLLVATVTSVVGGAVTILDSAVSNTVDAISPIAYNLHTISMFALIIAMLVISIIAMVRLGKNKSRKLILTNMILAAVSIILYLIASFVFQGSISSLLELVEMPMLINAIITLILSGIAFI